MGKSTETITLKQTCTVGGKTRPRGWSGEASQGEARELVNSGRAVRADSESGSEPAAPDKTRRKSQPSSND